MSEADRHGVLMLTSNYPRWPTDATTPFVHDLAVDLVKRNWTVTVVAPHAVGAARREHVDGVEVRRFRYLRPERAQTVCYDGGTLINLRNKPLDRAKLPALVGAEWATTARLLNRDYEILHAHWTLPQGFVAATTPNRQVARVLTVHGGDVFGLRGRVLDRFAAHALRRADRVTVATSATEAAVRDIAGGDVSVIRVPMGVDLSRSPQEDLVNDIRSRYRRPDGPLLVFMGRIVKDKGVDDIVTAVRILARDLPGVSAVIVGTGPDVARIREVAAANGVADRIAFPGWAEAAQVPSWFAAADAVLAPSRVGESGWEEGQGLSIIEAMAQGRPVVATRTGGIPDTVSDGVTGFLIPPSSPESLAAMVHRIVIKPDLAAEVGLAASRYARTEFDRESTSARMAAVYAEAIRDKRRS